APTWRILRFRRSNWACAVAASQTRPVISPGHRRQSKLERVSSCLRGRCRSRNHWQLEHDRGAVARRAVHLDLPAVVTHDPIRNRQPQTSALADFLCGEEWIKNAVLKIRRDTWSGVLEHDRHGLCVYRTPDVNLLLLDACNGVPSVREKVQKHLLELNRIAHDERVGCVEFKSH